MAFSTANSTSTPPATAADLSSELPVKSIARTADFTPSGRRVMSFKVLRAIAVRLSLSSGRFARYRPFMTDQTEAEQQRDRLLLRLLKTPPQPRPKRERGKEKTTTAGKVTPPLWMAGATYLGRRETHYVFRITWQDKPVLVCCPSYLAERWGPYAFDCAAFADSHERVAPAVLIGEGGGTRAW